MKLYDKLEKHIRFLSSGDITMWEEAWKKGEYAQDYLLKHNEVQTSFATKDQVAAMREEATATTPPPPKILTGKGPKKDKQKPPGVPKRQVAYVFMRDIIEAAVSMVQSADKAPASVYQYRVLVGPISYIERRTGIATSINIGQVPVAMSQFNRFLNETIVKENVARMSLMQFLKLAVKKLAVRALGSECAQPGRDLMKGTSMRSKVGLTVITHNSADGKDVFKGYEKKSNYPPVELLTGQFNNRARLKKARTAKKDKDLLFDYLVLHGSHIPTPHRTGNRKADEKEGVFHYQLGRDKGIVKNINFQRVDMPARRTYLMKQDIGAVDYLMERYNADMELVGFPPMTVGTLVHINPAIASMGDSRNADSFGAKLGLTGYYFITRLNYTISADNTFKTTVHCVGQGAMTGKKHPIRKLVSEKGASSAKEDKKKTNEGPDKGTGPEGETKAVTPNVNAAASDALAIVSGDSSIASMPLGDGSPGIDPLDPIFINDTRPDPSFKTSAGPDTARIPSACTDHVLGDKFARAALDYLTLLHPPSDNGDCTMTNPAPDKDDVLLDSSYWSDDRLSFEPPPDMSIRYEDSLINLNYCPETAFVQGSFKYLKDVDVGTWEDDGGDDLHDFSITTAMRNKNKQKRWKTIYYTYNCYKHPVHGWFIYDFFENIASATGER